LFLRGLQSYQWRRTPHFGHVQYSFRYLSVPS
jgi:hypothetical protein